MIADGALLSIAAAAQVWQQNVIGSWLFRLRPIGKAPAQQSPAVGRIFVDATAVQIMSLWAIAWDVLIGLNALWEAPACWPGFTFPFVAAVVDIAHSDRFESLQETNRTVRERLSQNATAIVSVVFAVGALMIVVADKRMVQGRRLMMYALGLLVLAVVPELSDSRKTGIHRWELIAQRAVYNVVIAMIISGIGLDTQYMIR